MQFSFTTKQIPRRAETVQSYLAMPRNKRIVGNANNLAEEREEEEVEEQAQ